MSHEEVKVKKPIYLKQNFNSKKYNQVIRKVLNGKKCDRKKKNKQTKNLGTIVVWVGFSRDDYKSLSWHIRVDFEIHETKGLLKIYSSKPLSH